MSVLVRILIVEDLSTDFELAQREIRKAVNDCKFQRVETRQGFLEALGTFQPDLILSDYYLPRFDGMTALKLALEHAPLTPLIIWTGPLGEDVAVDCMRAGASNYIIKENIKRLGPAVVHALEEGRLRLERKQTEKALLKAANKVLAMFSTIGDGITVSDSEGRILEANDAVVRLHGFENKEEILKAGISELVSDGDRKRLQSEGLKILKSGGSSVFECTLRRKDGSLFDGELRLSRLGDPKKDSPAIIGITRDITERKRVEEALQENRKFLADLIEYSAAIIFVKDVEGRYQLVNRKYEELRGITREKVIGRTAMELFPTAIAEKYHANDLRVMESGQTLESEDFVDTPQGRRYLITVKFPLYATDGSINGVCGMTTDITERKHTEEILRRQNDYLESLHQVSIDLLNRRNVDDLLNAVIENATRLLDAPYGDLDIVEGDVMITRAYTANQSFERDLRTRRGEAGEASWQAYDTRQPVVIDDYDTWSHRHPVFDEIPIHATIIVPLVSGDHCLGVFSLARIEAGRPFTPDEIRLTTLFAQLASLVLDQTQLYTDAQHEIEERKRTEEILRRQNDYLAALHEVTLGLINRLDPDEVLEVILTHVTDLMKTRHAYIDIVDPTAETLIQKVALGNYAPLLGYRTARGHGVTGRVWDSGEMLIIPDYSVWEDRLPGFTSFRTVIGTPLKVQGKIIGVIGIAFDEPDRTLTSEEVDLLQRFANLASIALDNAQLYTEAQREINERKQAEQKLAHRAAQLAVLHQLGQDIASLDLEHVYAATLRAVEWLMPTQAFFISLLDEERQEIRDAYLFDMGQRWPEESTPLATPSLTAHVIQTGKTLFIEDDTSGFSLTFGRTLFGTPEDTRSVIIAPLKLSGKVIGAISAQHYQPDMYTNADVLILEMLANQVAIAIQNARLFTERATLIKELEVKNAELDRFTHTVSHDLKSPLVTLRGFLQFLETDAQSDNKDRLKKDIQRINESVDKMQRLINELLELSQIGRIINPPEDVSFAEIVQDALSRVEGRLAARQIKVEIRGELPQVHGDRNRLVQVMQNLLDNAAKFVGDQPEPHIEIGTHTQDGKHIFYVKDNGVGIKPEFHDKVFGLFDKLDARSDGTGIGLALVKQIIEVHGGRVWVESDGIGKGTTFCFTLN